MDAIEILLACRMFSNVPERAFQRLVAMAQLSRPRRGERIFTEGDPCPGCFIVGEGKVRVFKSAASGKQFVMHVVEPGQTFAEVAAFGNFRVPASAEADEDAVCVLLPTAALTRALEEDHELALGLLRGMSRWVRHLVGMLEDIVLRDAVSRLARYLLELPTTAAATVELPMLKRHLASHLNLTSETLSRTLRRLGEAGLVMETGENRFRLDDPARLEQVAAGLHPRV